jgi:hypothetical protein
MSQQNVFYEGMISPAMIPGGQSASGPASTSTDRKFVVNPVIIQKTQYIYADCNEILFFNNGTSNVSILGIPLGPGIGLSIPGNYGEMDVTKYQAVFSGAGVNSLLVIRKNYTS